MSTGINRRSFIKLSSLGLAGTVLAGCAQSTRTITLEPYVNAPEDQVAGQATWYASTCRQCPAGCGIMVRIMNGRALKIEGNPEHPLNQGKLCARGQAGVQALYDPDRLQVPVVQGERGSRVFDAISWNEGLNRLYEQLARAGERVAVWCSPTISAHSYELFERFTRAVGAPAPLMYDLYAEATGGSAPSGMAGHSLQSADVVFSFNADFLGMETSAVRYGIEYGRFRQQESGKRGTLVQFEPRMTITGASADRWVPVRPGWEGALALALVQLIADGGVGPAERVQRARQLAPDVDIDAVAASCEISRSDLEALARLFAGAENPVALGGGAIHGHPQGSRARSAVEALNIVAGSPTMGESPASALNLPEKPLPAGYADVLDLIDQMKSGKVQALLVLGANPMYDLPPQSGIAAALAAVPFIASFAPAVDETAAWADLILPDRTPLESWGVEVTRPSFGQTILSSQQPVVQPQFESYSSGDILLTVARGIPAARAALPWDDEVAYLKDRVSEGLVAAGFETSREVAWARFLQHGGWWAEGASPAAHGEPSPAPDALDDPSYQGDEAEYPFILIPYLSGLLSDGRGANLTWLQGAPDPMTTMSWQTWVEINPQTARNLGVSDGDVVEVRSEAGSLTAPVYVYPAIRPDTIAIPFGQGHADLGRYARGRGANPIELIGSNLDETGTRLTWANQRVQVRATGDRIDLARFENPEGASNGFANQDHPG